MQHEQDFRRLMVGLATAQETRQEGDATGGGAFTGFVKATHNE